MPDHAPALPAFDPASLVGTTLDGRYLVESHLATGGMGAVFRARQVYMRKDVALKVLRPDLSASAELVERFRREAEIASSLDHPHIVRVTDFGRTPEGWLFLAMELLFGESLFERLRREAFLPPEEAVPILWQVCDGLEAAHARAVVHRDLKPENVFLARRGSGREVVKILDFGIAKMADPGSDSATQAGMVVGTPEYLSPEQATGSAVDGRSDLYTVGLIAWRMLTGRHPFKADEPRALLMMQATRPVPPITDPRPDLGAWPLLVAAVTRACAKDPAARYQTAADLKADLAASLGNEFVPPETTPSPRLSSGGMPAAQPSASGTVRMGAGLLSPAGAVPFAGPPGDAPGSPPPPPWPGPAPVPSPPGARDAPSPPPPTPDQAWADASLSPSGLRPRPSPAGAAPFQPTPRPPRTPTEEVLLPGPARPARWPPRHVVWVGATLAGAVGLVVAVLLSGPARPPPARPSVPGPGAAPVPAETRPPAPRPATPAPSPSPADAELAAAREQLAAGRPREARAALERLLVARPGDPELRRLLGHALHDQGDVAGAIEAWGRVQAAGGRLDPAALEHLGTDLMRDKRLADKAVRLLVRAGAEAAPALNGAIARGSNQVKLRALAAAREIGPAAAVDVLGGYLALLGDDDCDVRRAAAHGLGDLGDRRALPRLKERAAERRERRGLFGVLIESNPVCGGPEAEEAARRIEGR